MSLYYKLIEDDYKGEKENIGEIMLQFGLKLYDETGLSLGICMEPTNEEFQLHKNSQKLEILNEEVLWQNMTDSEKVIKFNEYLLKIGSTNGDLLIIDPYLFTKTKDSSYVNLLSNILNSASAKSITVITDKAKCSQKIVDEVQLMVRVNIKFIYADNWHDRFWISNRKKGFVLGTSLNGIGKRISLINYLSDSDVQDIMKEVNIENGI